MTSPDRARRGAHLTEARRRDSDSKTQRAVAAVARLQAAGERITFTRVARDARVSTWFTYNKAEVESAIRRAIEDQDGSGPALARLPVAERVSVPSLHTDLALARAEIKELKEQRDQLRKRLQLALGAELDAAGREELLNRVRELEQLNRTLASSEEALRGRIQLAGQRIESLENDLAAARLSLRRMVKDSALRPASSVTGQ